MKVLGNKEKKMAEDAWCILMGMFIKDNLKMIPNVEDVCFNIKMVTNLTDSCIFQMNYLLLIFKF